MKICSWKLEIKLSLSRYLLFHHFLFIPTQSHNEVSKNSDQQNSAFIIKHEFLIRLNYKGKRKASMDYTENSEKYEFQIRLALYFTAGYWHRHDILVPAYQLRLLESILFVRPDDIALNSFSTRSFRRESWMSLNYRLRITEDEYLLTI